MYFRWLFHPFPLYQTNQNRLLIKVLVPGFNSFNFTLDKLTFYVHKRKTFGFGWDTKNYPNPPALGRMCLVLWVCFFSHVPPCKALGILLVVLSWSFRQNYIRHKLGQKGNIIFDVFENARKRTFRDCEFCLWKVL